MKNIRQVTFRKMTDRQTDEVEKLLRKKKSPYPKLFGLIIICMLPFAGYSTVRSVQAGTGFAPILPYLVIVLILAVLLCQDGYHRRYRIKCCQNKKVSVADVVCINIKKQRAAGRYRVSYFFKNAEGESFKLKGRSVLRAQPNIGTKCLVVNFGDRYYSVM